MTFPVSMTGICKCYGSVQALRDVELNVESRAIHAVVGENGAGKTTLMRILYGAVRLDAGRIELDGEAVHFSNSGQAIERGVGMVSQHYSIIPELTCLQNLMLGAEGSEIINGSLAVHRADDLALGMGFQFDWHRPATGLSPAAAQKLEILKLLWRSSKIMILDEPTAMLSPADGEALFEKLGELASKGVTVIVVTHRLTDVVAHCSRVTVLRAGQHVAEMAVRDTNLSELARLVVGGSITEPPARAKVTGEVVLEVRNLDLARSRKPVSFNIRAGEIVGIAGVDGSGQRDLYQFLAGIHQQSPGTTAFRSRDISQVSTAERIRQGIRMIPEDRHAEGLISEWSLEENAALGLQQLAPFARGGRIAVKERRSAASAIADMFATKHGGLQEPIRSLSGGNQQRFVAARAMFLDPRLLLAFQPARGLDLNSTTVVYRAIRKACENGAGALVISFDLDELIEYCDRILVMNRGELWESPSFDREAIGRLMVIGDI